MPRSKQNIKRASFDGDKIETAVRLLKEKKFSLHGASKHFQIPRTSLRRYYSYVMKEGTSVKDIRKNLAVKRIFDDEQERMLVNYIKEAAILQFGLTLKEVKKLAYQFAKANQIKYPTKWDSDKMAGEYWLRLFRKRFKNEISLRKPEATSLARSSAFNKHTVALTFNNYKKALSQCPSDIQAADIWNIDETGLSTVHVPPKILAPTGVKQLGSVTSAERGNTVTMIAACNAGGGFIPPMLIFSRVNFKNFMIHGAPEGTLGAANPSGWSNETTFLMFMNHFIKFARPTKERPAIVLMDNHESHISVPTIRLAKENGIILVTLHPHTSNKMQPLDKSVFGPFKNYFNHAANEKMMTPGNIGKPLTIYDIAALVGKAFPRAFTPTNISNGFKATGFHPLNEDIFSEADFMAANFSDRPIHSGTSAQSLYLSPKGSSAQAEQSQETLPAQVDHLLSQECSAQADDLLTQKQAEELSAQDDCIQLQEAIAQIYHQPPESSSQAAAGMIAPEMIRPHPKAAPRKATQKGRQKGKSRILTDTPEKNEIELLKSAKKVAPKNESNLKKPKKEKRKVDKVKRKVLVESDSEESNYSIHDTDDSCEDKISEISEEENVEYEIGDFVIFIYEKEYFVGQIKSLNEEGVFIKSM